VVAQSRGAPGRGHPHRNEPPGRVRAVQATGEERDRLWKRLVAIEPEIQGYASRRGIETPVVVFEPLDVMR